MTGHRTHEDRRLLSFQLSQASLHGLPKSKSPHVQQFWPCSSEKNDSRTRKDIGFVTWTLLTWLPSLPCLRRRFLRHVCQGLEGWRVATLAELELTIACRKNKKQRSKYVTCLFSNAPIKRLQERKEIHCLKIWEIKRKKWVNLQRAHIKDRCELFFFSGFKQHEFPACARRTVSSNATIFLACSWRGAPSSVLAPSSDARSP